MDDPPEAIILRKRICNSLQGILDQLYDIMYEFDFSLPPDYALVIRALGSLEGTAKALDPSFKVVESAYPYVIGRLLADSTPDMRRILRELLIRSNGSIRWNRLERLVRRKHEPTLSFPRFFILKAFFYYSNYQIIK